MNEITLSSKPWLDPNLPPIPALTEAELRQVEIFRSMTPFQRWERAIKLRQMVGEIRKMSLKADHPGWSEEKLEEAVRDFFIHAST